jgi:hypothetical protein
VDYQKYDLPDITGPTIVTIGVDIKDIPKVQYVLMYLGGKGDRAKSS